MLPILGALVLQAAYGAVDLLVVGRFGSTSGLSAVSTGSQVLNLVTFVVTQFAMGSTVLIARYLGEKKPERIGSVIGGAAVVFAVISAILFIVMIAFAHPISVLMQAPAEAVSLTTSYVKICGSGIFFIVAYNLLAAIFRGLGDSKSPLLFVLVACIVNIFGDLFLVAGLHLDAAGAALATVFAQAVSVVCAIVILLKKKLPFSIQKSDFRFNSQCKRFLGIGLPLALQEFLTQLSFLALCAFVNRLGLEASSGYGVACKIVNFAMLIPSALMQSMASFVSQNVGAGKPKRAKQSMFTGIGVGLLFGCLVFVAIPIFDKRDERLDTLTDESVDVYYSCILCQAFAPSHVCVVTPERLGLCGAVSWLDAKATHQLDPAGPCQIITKERPIDENLGSYEDVDEAVQKFSQGALEHVTLYSIMQDPMTSCGCFECISCTCFSRSWCRCFMY